MKKRVDRQICRIAEGAVQACRPLMNCEFPRELRKSIQRHDNARRDARIKKSLIQPARAHGRYKNDEKSQEMEKRNQTIHALIVGPETLKKPLAEYVRDCDNPHKRGK